MNIIFGKDQLDAVDSKYTVLELDTFRMKDDEIITAYCVVENIPITEMSTVDNFSDLHAKLIAGYREKNWKLCEDLLEHLVGRWNHELDTFYTEMAKRIQEFKKTGVPNDWDGIIDRSKDTVA